MLTLSDQNNIFNSILNIFSLFHSNNFDFFFLLNLFVQIPNDF